MTHSVITDKFIQAADGLLEQRINGLAEKFAITVDIFSESLASHRLSLSDAYFADVRALNAAGKILAENGFAYEPINHQIAFLAAWDRLASPAVCESLVKKYEPE